MFNLFNCQLILLYFDFCIHIITKNGYISTLLRIKRYANNDEINHKEQPETVALTVEASGLGIL